MWRSVARCTRAVPRPRAGLLAGAGVLGVLFSLPATLAAQATPAGTQVSVWATASYEASNGVTYTVASDTLVIVVGQVAGVDVDPPGSSVTDPGRTVVFVHALANIGNGADSFTVAAASSSGWPVRLFLDANGNGVLDPSDPPIAGPLARAAGQAVQLLAAVDVPADPALRGTSDTLSLRAVSLFDPGVADSLTDVLEVRDVGILVSLIKTVDRTSATIGDILTYSIRYTATGPSPALNFRIADVIPLGARYVPQTLQLNGITLSDADGDDAGAFDAAGNRIVVRVGDIPGGADGTVSFQVRVEG